MSGTLCFHLPYWQPCTAWGRQLRKIIKSSSPSHRGSLFLQENRGRTSPMWTLRPLNLQMLTPPEERKLRCEWVDYGEIVIGNSESLFWQIKERQRAGGDFKAVFCWFKKKNKPTRKREVGEGDHYHCWLNKTDFIRRFWEDMRM